MMRGLFRDVVDGINILASDWVNCRVDVKEVREELFVVTQAW